MKQTIEIEVPDGYVAEYNPSDNKVKIVKIDDKPKSWEELEDNYKTTGKEYYINDYGTTIKTCQKKIHINCRYFPDLETTNAFEALRKLIFLRNAWVKDWKPNYTKDKVWHIHRDYSDTKLIVKYGSMPRILSFPSAEMATEFYGYFSELIEIAKPLL